MFLPRILRPIQHGIARSIQLFYKPIRSKYLMVVVQILSRDRLSGFTHGGEGSVNVKTFQSRLKSSKKYAKMKVKTKKILTKIAIATFFFLAGTEYGKFLECTFIFSKKTMPVRLSTTRSITSPKFINFQTFLNF